MTTKKGKGKKATSATTWSLTECAIAYLESLKAAKKSASTVNAYSADLDLAVEVLGGDTPITAIGIDQVHAFNQSDPVMKTKSGRDKSMPTIERSRRVLRLALVHAEREGMLAEAPIPAKKKNTTEVAPVEPTPAKTKRAKKDVPLSQREPIGNDDAKIYPAAADDDPAQIVYASTGEPVSA